jgi:hypothetical protein
LEINLPDSIFVALVSLNFAIFGVNIIKFKALTPDCEQILTQAQCDLSPQIGVARLYNLPSKLTFSDIILGEGPDPVQYVLDYWNNSMTWRIFGIMGHRTYKPIGLAQTFFRLLFIWSLFITIKYWKKPSFVIVSLFSIFIFYTIVLIETNYNSELINGFSHIAIQGRYIFPVIGILYTLMVYYFAGIPYTILRRSTVGFVLLLFLYASPVLVLFFTTHPSIDSIWANPISTSWFH